MVTRSRISLALLTMAALAGALAVPAATAGAATAGHQRAGRWVSTWAASPMAATPPSLTSSSDFSSAGFSDQTIRNVVWTSAGGRSARIRLSNVFGTRPVSFGQVDIGVSAGGAAVASGTNRRVTFGGRGSVTIRPGAEVVSDPVPLSVPAETDLAVSLFTAAPTGPATYHSDAQQVNYVSAGDQAGSDSAAAFTTTSQSWYFLDDVDVQASPASGGVVAFGDSITDGYQSTVGANARWPNDLARRFLAAGQNRAVADEGISGNRVLNDSACFGVNAQSRFFRDVAQRSGARDVIMLEGINDIGFSQDPDSGCTAPNTDVSAAQIIAGYRHIIAAAHAAGLRIFGATLTPFQGSAYYSAAGEAKREAVNHWIRTSRVFDGVIDFDQAVRDPASPLQILPAYDSGDHLHPNDAGYQAMANAINLAMFRG
ncbi:MAG TPA: SGNH/GDSL hydrolase family protein [Streptosporangiaceae bacterium]|nr:SGNH/GDSL hydrolase family protein [Streptosporangiaceae bacterium]